MVRIALCIPTYQRHECVYEFLYEYSEYYQKHGMDIPFGYGKKSSIYCHNVPSLCLRMPLSEAAHSSRPESKGIW